MTETTKAKIDAIDELLAQYVTKAEETFGRKMKRNGLIFQVAKELKRKYESID